LIIRQSPLPTLIVAQLKALADTVKEKNNGKQEDKTKTSTVQDITIGVTQIADLVKKEPTKPLTKEEVENIRTNAASFVSEALRSSGLNRSQKDQKDFTYPTRWDRQIPTEWYNAIVLVLLGLVALAISRVMIWRGWR
jgi:hypothetical protein